MKLIIAGSRDATMLPSEIMKYLVEFDWYDRDLEIVSGGARGMDTAAEVFSKQANLRFHLFPADWTNKGKAAGFVRNKEMGDFADALFAVWDGKSRGTKHMIDYMQTINKPVKVVYFGKYNLEE